MTSKTALFVGAGAVVNAWEPVVEALQEFTRIDGIDSDQASCMLTRTVYLGRFFTTVEGPDGADDRYDLLNKMKVKIAEKLRDAETSGRIFAREDLEWVIDQLVLPRSTEFYAISTNWDNAVGASLKAILSKHGLPYAKVFQIHGSYEDPKTMYLPSEVTFEPYRDESTTLEIGGMHAGLVTSLSELEHLVVYGLSLDPLDAELTQIISMVIDSTSIRTIDILDIDPQKVAKRISLLMKRPELPQIRCFTPDDIS